MVFGDDFDGFVFVDDEVFNVVNECFFSEECLYKVFGRDSFFLDCFAVYFVFFGCFEPFEIVFVSCFECAKAGFKSV